MREERGFTLIELMISITLMTLVIGTTLTAFGAFDTNSQRNQTQNDEQNAARIALDQLARDLRNAAAPSWDPTAKTSTQAITTATASDLVFQAVDSTGASGGSNVRHSMWVRYCLDRTIPANQKLWKQTLTWTSATQAAPSSSVCPDTSAWPGTPQLVADHVVNTSVQPFFSFYPTLNSIPTASDYSHISRISMDLFVNYDSRRTPTASELQTAVYLRNQAQPPRAGFSYQVSGSGGVYLNGSSSSDDAGYPLSYLWCDTTTTSTCTAGAPNVVGQGVTAAYDAPSGTRSITLVASDPSGVSDTTTQQVAVP